MDEILRWWWSFFISRRDVENMKKNMKKVPIIQKKAEKYHTYQNEEAESFINQSLKNNDIDTISKHVIQTNNVYKSWFRKNIVYYVKNLFSNIYHGN